jgi:hypothetical protein
VGFDEAGFVGFEVFFWVEVVRVFLDLERFCLFAEVDTFLEVVLHDVHFSDDSLQSDQFVGKLAVKAAGGDKVGSEVAIEADLVVFYFGLEAGFLLAEEGPFKEVFG